MSTAAYVTTCENCGGLDGAVVVDSGNHVQKRDMVKQMIRWAVRGRRISTMPLEDVRKATWCQCRGEKQSCGTGTAE